MSSQFPDDLAFSTIAELGGQLRARKVSAHELTRGFAERLESIGPTLNAVALPLTRRAEKHAKEIDGDFKRERIRGPLQGIPYGAKDLLSVAKFPTSWGAKPYADQTFDFDATVIARLAKTGAPLLAKLAMIELAGAGGYESAGASLFGPCLNPWDRTRWAGGSSSGSAASVAAGLVPFAIGSETSGSILTPAAFCGVTGLRPTYGLVSRYGAMPLSWTMDKLGPIGRTAEDCAFVLETIAGGDSKDPASSGKSFYYTPQFARPLGELKIGYAEIDFTETAAAETRSVFEQALAALRDTGVQIVPAQLKDLPYGDIASTIVSAEGASVFEDLITSGKVDQLADPAQIAGLKASLEIASRDYLRAMRLRTLVKQQFHEIFAALDILIAPARTNIAPRLDEMSTKPPSPPALSQTTARGLRGLVPAGNLAGLPALSVPCGFVNGLPIALQLVGPAWSENTLIAVGRAFQQRTSFHKRRPSSSPTPTISD